MQEEQRLKELEEVGYAANKVYDDSLNAYQAAGEKRMAAEEAYRQASSDLYNTTYSSSDMAEKQEAFRQAKQALDEAKEQEEKAAENFEAAAKAAQDAADQVEEQKQKMRDSAYKDTTYVVHTARIECTCGLRESYLVLGDTHGVKTRQCPQMTVKDCVLNENIINFGGCHSMENPSTREAAEHAVQAAQDAIAAKREEMNRFEKWLDSLASIFVKDTEVEAADSLMEQCVGECIAEFPPDASWIRGHSKVSINGEQVLLRRCSRVCNYGGRITILMSGQPE